MKYHFNIFALLILCLPSVESQAQMVPDMEWKNHSTLKRQISVEATGITLRQLLQAVSTKESNLTCEQNDREVKLQVRLINRPLLSLMTALSDLLPGEWIYNEEQKTYLLRMTTNAEHKRTVWWRTYNEAKQDAIAAMSQRIYRNISHPRILKSNDPNAERGNPELEREEQNNLILISTLPEELRRRISSNFNIIKFYSTGIQAFGAIPQDTGTAVPFSTLPTRMQENFRHQMGKLTFDDDNIVTFTNTGASLISYRVEKDGTRRSTGFSLSLSLPVELAVLCPDHGFLADKVSPSNRDVRTHWRTLAQNHRQVRWKNDPPKPTRLSFPPPRRADVINEWGKNRGMEYIADYYSRPCFPQKEESKITQMNLSVTEELNRFAKEQDVSWKKREDGLYLFRNNRWYRDDKLEVSNAGIRQLLASGTEFAKAKESAQKLKAQLNWASEIFRTLTPYQIFNGLRWYSIEKDNWHKGATVPYHFIRPFSMICDYIAEEYSLVTIYSGLSNEQQALLLGSRLDWNTLNPTLKEQVISLAPHLYATLTANDSSPKLLGLTTYTPSVRMSFGGTDNVNSCLRTNFILANAK